MIVCDRSGVDSRFEYLLINGYVSVSFDGFSVVSEALVALWVHDEYEMSGRAGIALITGVDALEFMRKAKRIGLEACSNV